MSSVKRALLIGINYINSESGKLNGCIDDVVNMSEILQEKYGYTEDNIVVLRDDSSDKSSQPTKANMIAALQYIVSKSAECEEIWIHYSGHGSQVRCTNKSRPEIDGLDEVIVPCDYSKVGFISDNDIFDIIKNIKCRALILFDSCHSGSVCDLEWGFEYIRDFAFKRSRVQNTVISNPNIFMFSGCKDPQTSADVYDTESSEYVGAFTDAFLDTLKASNYTTSLARLLRNICVLLSTRGFSQKPLLSSSTSSPTYTLTASPSSSVSLSKSVISVPVEKVPTSSELMRKRMTMSMSL
jgi:hypothetical protein